MEKVEREMKKREDTDLLLRPSQRFFDPVSKLKSQRVARNERETVFPLASK